MVDCVCDQRYDGKSSENFVRQSSAFVKSGSNNDIGTGGFGGTGISGVGFK